MWEFELNQRVHSGIQTFQMMSQKQISFVLLVKEHCNDILRYNLMKNNKQLNYLTLHIIHQFLVKILKREHLELLNECFPTGGNKLFKVQ